MLLGVFIICGRCVMKKLKDASTVTWGFLHSTLHFFFLSASVFEFNLHLLLLVKKASFFFLHFHIHTLYKHLTVIIYSILTRLENVTT